MITQLSDEMLADYSDEDIAAYISEEHCGGHHVPSGQAIAHYISVMRMEPKLREDIFRLFHSAPLLCSECGRPSCIHGYPDD
jgi:hypothetical protein